MALDRIFKIILRQKKTKNGKDYCLLGKITILTVPAFSGYTLAAD